MSREEFAAFHRDLFDKYYGMAERLLKSSLILPALEYALKCSHIFNILDSSGSVGVTRADRLCASRAADRHRDRAGICRQSRERRESSPRKRTRGGRSDKWIVSCYSKSAPKRCRRRGCLA